MANIRMASQISVFALFLIALVLGGMSCTAPQSSQSSEEEIWQLEEAYVANHGKADHAAILSAYHRDFLGWPDESSRPLRKADMPDLLQKSFPKPTDNVAEIERGGIQVKDNVAMTQYSVHDKIRGGDPAERKVLLRITHTWLKEDGRWQILGGMSNEVALSREPQ